jgi:transmembrane sensor
MNLLKTQPPIRPAVLEEAAGWLVEFRSGDPQPSDRRDFDNWLRISPEHVRAYLTLLPTWENGAQLDLSRQPSAARLMQLARSGEDNVVPLAASSFDASVPPRKKSRVRGAAIAAAAAFALITATYFGYSAWRNPTYATGTGEQRSITLADGSTAELNSRSRLRVRFSERRRIVELLEGQALFSVAKNSARPFIVHSGLAAVRAVGTQFDVYKKSAGTIVTVVEGRVAVISSAATTDNANTAEAFAPGADSGDAASTPEILLVAGEQITVTAHPLTQPKKANLTVATAWTQRRLIFSATPLTEVAVEFNRHNSRRLTVGQGLETFRINGIFSSADPTALLGFLREQPGISVTESNTEVRVSRK